MAKAFQAVYSYGRCVECGEDIVAGEWVTKSADQRLRHAECDSYVDWDEYFGYLSK